MTKFWVMQWAAEKTNPPLQLDREGTDTKRFYGLQSSYKECTFWQDKNIACAPPPFAGLT